MCQPFNRKFRIGISMAIGVSFGVQLTAQAQWTVLGPASTVTWVPNSAGYFFTCYSGGAAGPVSCAALDFPTPDGHWWLCGVFLDGGANCGSATSIEDGIIQVSGANTPTLRVRALNLAYDDYDCKYCPGGPYAAVSYQDLFALILVRIDAPGVPPGAPVAVSFRWSVLAAARAEGPVVGPSGGNLAASAGALAVNGATQFAGDYDVWDTSGARFGEATGSFTVGNGSTIPIMIAQYVDAYCLPPPSPAACPAACSPLGDPCILPHNCVPENDTASARRETNVWLSIGAAPGSEEPPPPPPECPMPTLEFSIDLGSDAEWSDPTPDGNEAFDPFDTYVAGGPPIPFPGAHGVRTDILARGGDIPPLVPGGPGAPTCAGGAPSGATFLDLDGTDSIDFSLAGLLTSGPLSAPVPRFPSACVQELSTLLISFDDDGPAHWAGAPPGVPCPIPVGSSSPAGMTYGSALGRDELFSVSLIPTAGGCIASQAPAGSETDVHPSLAPDPPPDFPPAPTPQEFDDDVDAIDLTGPGCGTWLFGADHEARATFGPLNAIIYEYAGGPVSSIPLPAVLGIPSTTDVRDFELVWAPYPLSGGPQVLMFIFTVAPDDPLTVPDESGGLDARMIYASYLTGTSFPLLVEPLPDAVDAVANWCGPVIPGSPPPTPPCATCDGDMNGDSRRDGADIQQFVGCVLLDERRPCRCASIDGWRPSSTVAIAGFVERLLAATTCP